MNELPGLSADRLKRAIAAFVRELFPQQDYFGFYLYSVAAWDNGAQTGDLIPQSTTVGLPQLGRVPIRLPGIKVNLSVGQEVLVGFDNHDPTRPFIAHLGTLATGLLPISVVLDSQTTVSLAGGTDAIALAQLVQTALDTIRTQFNAHTHISATPGNPTAVPVPLIAALGPVAAQRSRAE